MNTNLSEDYEEMQKVIKLGRLIKNSQQANQPVIAKETHKVFSKKGPFEIIPKKVKIALTGLVVLAAISVAMYGIDAALDEAEQKEKAAEESMNKPVIEQMQERDAQEAIAWEENEEETEGRGL